jgi:MFS family permease
MKRIIHHIKSHLAQEKGLKTMYLLAFILAVATALPTYIESNYIQNFVSVSSVSVFFASANALTVLAILFFPSTIKRHGNYKVTSFILAINFASLLLMFLANSPFILFCSFMLLLSSFNLIWINMDIFVKSFTVTKKTGRTRAIYFTVLNLGWIISPLITSYFIESENYRLVYVIAALFLIPFYFIFHKKSRRLKDKIRYEKINFKKTFKKIWFDNSIRGIFFVAFLLQLFFSLAVVYIPLYLHQDLGFDWSTLGIMFSIMLFPFILFEIPAGILADKYWGEKEILYGGFTILIISLGLFFFTTSTNAIIWTLILFFSRIGAALVESMREAYFFKIVSLKEVALIDFFRITQPLGYLVGTLLATLIVLFLPINYVFITSAILMLSAYHFIWILRDTK